MITRTAERLGIEPHIPVFDKSARKDGSLSRADFTYDHAGEPTPVRKARWSTMMPH